MSKDLPDATRQALSARQVCLAEALAPANDRQIRAVLATLADMPAAAESDHLKARFALERDILDLKGLPEWAIADAARAYRRGEVGDGRCAPLQGSSKARAGEVRCSQA